MKTLIFSVLLLFAMSVVASAQSGEFAPTEVQQQLKVHLSFKPRGNLDKVLEDIQDPASPSFHKWLSSGEFDARFGRTPPEMAAVSRWLSEWGFQVEGVSNRGIDATSTVKQANAAFAANIVRVGTRYANMGDPMIPPRFADVIGSIEGLNNAQRSIALATKVTPDYNNGAGKGFSPSDLWTFYDETSLISEGHTGAGNCIALIEDSDFLTAPVTLFDTTFNLPAANITRVFADSSSPGDGPDELEALVDVEWVHAVAPGAAIYVYEGNALKVKHGALPLVDAIKRAVTDNKCAVISISYMIPGGYNMSTLFTGTLDPLFRQAAAQGQSLFIGSGDTGATTWELNSSYQLTLNPTPAVSEMAADPYVTAAGGTQYDPTYQNNQDLGFAQESAWNDQAGSTGGGYSSLFTKPSWQVDSLSSKMRRVPDISAGASPWNPGFYYGADNGSKKGAITCCIGGTSISAPILAGLFKVIGANGRLGEVNQRLYALGAMGDEAVTGLRDVTVGNNTYKNVAGYSAGPGYDLVTGNGTPDMAKLAAEFPQ